MNGLGIRGKLQLSVGALAMGYLCFFALVRWTSSTTQKHLETVSNSIYPAAISIEHAQAGFQKMSKDYKDAVLLQDAKSLAAADQDAELVTAQLAIAKDKTAYDPALQRQVGLIMGKFTQLYHGSQATYTQMVETPESLPQDAQASMTALANERTEVEQMFLGLSDSVGRKAFEAELGAVSESNDHQRLFSIFLFLTAVAFAVGTILVMEKQVAVPLRELARRLGEGAHQVATSASQVSGSGLSIAEGASRQAASLQETSSSSYEISAMAQKSAADCHSASRLVTMSQQKFADTNRSMEELVAAMGQISASSGKVIKIIKTINGIAFETKILALNAAVQAARAGESGLGFAVVAEEVHDLAEKCAQAAEDSATIVDESIQSSEQGKAKLDEVSASIREVTNASVKVNALVDQITAASGEQTRGISQIAKSISMMEQVTQTSAGTADQSAAAAEQLTAQANVLNDIVARLSRVIEGRKPPTRRAAPSGGVLASQSR